MSIPYQIFVLIPEGINQEKIVYKTHEIIVQLGGCLDEESLLILNDIEDEEYEPEYLENSDLIEKAITKLAKWPTHGSISYFLKDLSPLVTYLGEPNSKTVSAIKFSLTQGFFKYHEDEAKPFYIELAKKLHTKFQAKRTIMDWGIECEGFVLEEELERLKRNNFVGKYSLLDIKSD
jgi:hypothetical protein